MTLAYYPMYPTDFDADTGHLSMAEDGCYNRLLRLSWRCPECKMPDDLDWICRKARAVTEADRALVVAVLGEFFKRGKGKVWNPRLHVEWMKANENHKERVSTGKRGGLAKARKEKEIRSSLAIAEPKLSLSNQNQNQNHKEREETDGGDGSARDAILPVSQADEPTDRELILAAIGVDPVSGLTGRGGAMLGKAGDMAEAAQWLELPGLTVPLVCDEIRRIMAVKRDGPPKSFRYFTEAMQRLSGAMTLPPLQPIAPTAPAQPRDMWAEVEAELERRRQASADVLPFPRTADGA